jgi:phage baseplate assembly protein gpV
MKNELMFGQIVEQDAKRMRVRVKFADHDDMTSWWLPVLQKKTKGDKFCHMIDVGEHVACMMDDKLEVGVVLGAMYSKRDPVPVVSTEKDQVRYADGTVKEYDRALHKDDIAYMDNATFSYDAENHKHYFNYMDGASATYQAEFLEGDNFTPAKYKFHHADGAEMEYIAAHVDAEKEIDVHSSLRITLPGALINITMDGTTGKIVVQAVNIDIIADGIINILAEDVNISNCNCE